MRPFKLVMQWLFGILFVLAGLNHFRNPDFYVSIMPPYLPWHLELVYLSGVLEAILGVVLLIPRCTVFAAWALVALLIAVFPANIQMALNTELYPRFSPWIIWLRLPLQGLLIAWAYWFTRSVGQS